MNYQHCIPEVPVSQKLFPSSLIHSPRLEHHPTSSTSTFSKLLASHYHRYIRLVIIYFAHTRCVLLQLNDGCLHFLWSLDRARSLACLSLNNFNRLGYNKQSHLISHFSIHITNPTNYSFSTSSRTFNCYLYRSSSLSTSPQLPPHNIFGNLPSYPDLWSLQILAQHFTTFLIKPIALSAATFILQAQT